VKAFGAAIAATQVSYATTAFVMVGALVIWGTFHYIRSMIQEAVEIADREGLSPSDYAIYVRGGLDLAAL
jgi:hypothetical protein